VIPLLLLALQVPGSGALPSPSPAVAAAPAPRVASDAPVPGAADTEVAIPRLDGEVEVDGVLDEAVWNQAAVLRGFFQYSPLDGVPAGDSTRVLVWYAPDAIHFGIRAYADPSSVRATLAERDRIENDDHVLILLDTFNDGRRASVFGVNPFGIQMDGIRLEGEGGSGGFFRAEAEVHPLDRNPDFNYSSVGRLTDHGYEVEVRIPFKSLRYQPSEVQDWGVNIVRVVQATGHSHTWTPARRGRASFLAQSGRLVGLTGLERGMVFEFQPEITGRVEGARDPGGQWGYGSSDPNIGGNLTWGISENLTVNGTIRPDFSQVEADAGRLTYDPRTAIAFPEKRPFFLEGSERFRVPNQLIYTRQIVQPDVAVKANGSFSGFEVGLLSALDDDGISATGERPLFNIVRVQRNVGEASTLGLVYTDRTEGDGFNRVVGLDTRLVMGDYTLTAQGAGSFTEGWVVEGDGHLWDLGLTRAGRTWGFSSAFRGTSADFITRSGFVARSGTASVRVTPRMTRFGAADSRLESWSSSMMFSGAWLHDAFWEGGTPEDIKFHWNNTLSLRGGWSVTGSVLLERFYYPPYLYTDYAIERTLPAGTDTIPFTGVPSIGNLDFILSVATPQWNRVGANLTLIAGRDENFDEWAMAYIAFIDGGLDWRPTEQLRVSPTYARQQYIRPDDRSTVRVRNLPRMKVEYQLSRSIFVRGVAQYDARRRDALRDDTRTGDPILIRNPATGIYERTGRVSRNDIQGDLLFAWQPNPGTVLFAGYGSVMSEENAFRFREVERARDGFFVKLSYLMRN
jgi:hypothetical protein